MYLNREEYIHRTIRDMRKLFDIIYQRHKQIRGIYIQLNLNSCVVVYTYYLKEIITRNLANTACMLLRNNH